MKKTIVCLVLSLALILSTTAAVFAVDDVGADSIKKAPIIVVPNRVDDPGI